MLALALAAGRIAIGAGVWLGPRRSLGALGLSGLTAEALAVARLAATRDLIVGLWVARSLSSRDSLAGPVAAATACDAGDALAFALLARAGNRRAGFRGLAAAVPATAAGTWLSLRLSSR